MLQNKFVRVIYKDNKKTNVNIEVWKPAAQILNMTAENPPMAQQDRFWSRPILVIRFLKLYTYVQMVVGYRVYMTGPLGTV